MGGKSVSQKHREEESVDVGEGHNEDSLEKQSLVSALIHLVRLQTGKKPAKTAVDAVHDASLFRNMLLKHTPEDRT